MDCDGVLTDGRLYLGANGEELKVFHARDGQGIVDWHAAGFRSGIISGRNSPIVATRAPPALRALAARLLMENDGLRNGPSQIGAIPIFTIAPDRLILRTPSRHGRRIGWRFLRVGDGLSDQIDISLIEADRWAYCAGPVVSVTCRYGNEASDAFVNRPRILALSYVHMEALWIHSPKPGARDRYYGLPQDQPNFPNRGFMKEARRRLSLMQSASEALW